jgi:hypothetical protein
MRVRRGELRPMTGRTAGVTARALHALRSIDKAWIIAVAIILAGFLIGGQYEVVSVREPGYVVIVNRLTGSAWICFAPCRPLH